MSENKVSVQTKWQGVWGERLRAPSGNEYQVSSAGELEVSEEDARELCSTSGFRRKPVSVPQKQPMTVGEFTAETAPIPATEPPKGKGKGKKTPLKAQVDEAPPLKAEAEEPTPETSLGEDEDVPADEVPAE